MHKELAKNLKQQQPHLAFFHLIKKDAYINRK